MSTDPNELFIQLLEGRIPDSVSGIDPAEYARMLIRAIDYHEEQRQSAAYDRSFNEEWLEFLQEAELTEAEVYEEDLMLGELLRQEIDCFKSQISEAESRKEACENMLMILLRDYPELNDILETEGLP